jgi:hypothetical protein
MRTQAERITTLTKLEQVTIRLLIYSFLIHHQKCTQSLLETLATDVYIFTEIVRATQLVTHQKQSRVMLNDFLHIGDLQLYTEKQSA